MKPQSFSETVIPMHRLFVVKQYQFSREIMATCTPKETIAKRVNLFLYKKKKKPHFMNLKNTIFAAKVNKNK